MKIKNRIRAAKATTIAAAVATLLQMQAAHSVEFVTGNSDLKMRWDNTVKYSAAYRLKEQSADLLPDINLDDGDRNFNKGLVSNRVDLLSEFDASLNNLGMRLSGAAWYDTVYNRGNDNNSPFTNNSTSVRFNEFTDGTRRLHGRHAEILDAFVYAKGDVANRSAVVRLGRHTLQYGESLFFGSNGIANAQGPVDLVKLLTVPGSQFKEILRPVNQISGQLQLQSNVSLGAYYQMQWNETKIPGAGSYLSQADFVGDGAERIIVGAPIVSGAGPAAFWRGNDIKAKNSGQGGLQMRFTPENTGLEFGLYAARYHDKTPYIYFNVSNPANVNLATGQVGTLHQVFAENINTFGASLSTTVGGVNVAGEISVRHNTPLVSDPQVVLPGMIADNNNNPLYAVGRSAHAQISAIYVFTPNALLQGGAILGELAWNRRTSITKNAAALDPHTTRDAWAMRMIFEPAYYQVVQGLDITVPFGLGYNIDGRSSTIFNWNGGSSHGGDSSIGIKGTYRQVWQFGLSYVHFLGAEGTFLTPANSPTPVLSYKQSLKDRDFIAFNLQRTF
jgi:hypothetical protein